MKLSDVMSGAELSVYAEVGLVLFLLAFLGVVIHASWPGRKASHDEALMIPLSEEPASCRSGQREEGR